eukprot:1317198-Prymnesium_polylepis.1
MPTQCRETPWFLDKKKVRCPSLLEATPQSAQRFKVNKAVQSTDGTRHAALRSGVHRCTP